MSLEKLCGFWRLEAERLRPFNAGAAIAFETCARQIEETLRDSESELLTLSQAADFSGFSADHLGRLIRQGKITNFGRQNAPRVRCADLPRKAKASSCLTDSPGSVTSFSQVARAVLHRHTGGGDD